MLSVTLLLEVDLRSTAYSLAAAIMLPEIRLSFEFTVTKPFTALFWKVVFLAAAAIVTVPKTLLSVATTFLPLIVKDLAVFPVKIDPSVTVKAPSVTLLFSTRLYVPIAMDPPPVMVLFLYTFLVEVAPNWLTIALPLKLFNVLFSITLP